MQRYSKMVLTVILIFYKIFLSLYNFNRGEEKRTFIRKPQIVEKRGHTRTHEGSKTFQQETLKGQLWEDLPRGHRTQSQKEKRPHMEVNHARRVERNQRDFLLYPKTYKFY